MTRFLAILITVFIGRVATAQMNDPLYDLNQKVHFGFSIIGTYGKMKFSRNEHFFSLPIDTLNSITTTNFPGRGVGGIVNFHLNEFWDLRTMAIVQVMSQRNLTYHFKGGMTKTAMLQSTYFEVPLLIKYKSVRHKNFRMYVIGGIGYRYNFTSDAETERSATKPIVGMKASTINYDLGFGFDLYYPYFKFSPELKFSFGMRDLTVQENTIYTVGLDRVSSRAIYISFLFE
jgi:hypothetical protein